MNKKYLTETTVVAAGLIAEDNKNWMDRMAKNPNTGNMVKISSLDPADREKYRPKDNADRKAKREKKRHDKKVSDNVAKWNSDTAKQLSAARAAKRKLGARKRKEKAKDPLHKAWSKPGGNA